MAAIGPVLVVLSIPLILRWVPRNSLYGFRIPATLGDDAVWYEVNARSGRHALLLGLLMVALEFVLPRASYGTVLPGIAIAGLAIITIINWRYANRLARS